MRIERTDVVWLEARSDYSAVELAEMSGLPQQLLDVLIECGALPVSAGRTAPRTPPRFDPESIVLAQAARRLHDHFELDEQGLAVAVSLLRRVRGLEVELAQTRARAMAIID